MVKLTGLKKIKTAVFISGTGSNLKNLIKFSKIKNSPISINLIFSNTSRAKGLKFSNQFNIKKKISSFKHPKIAEKKILDLLNKENIKFICLINNIFFSAIFGYLKLDILFLILN